MLMRSSPQVCMHPLPGCMFRGHYVLVLFNTNKAGAVWPVTLARAIGSLWMHVCG
jgi:hypothetical protein